MPDNIDWGAFKIIEYPPDFQQKTDWSQFSVISDSKKKESQERGFTGHLKDTALDFAKGVVSFGESAVGLGSIFTFGAIGNAMKAIGYDPQQTQEFLSGMQSEQRHKAENEVAKADVFFDTAYALGTNPSVLIGSIVQSVPGMLAAGGIGGALAKRLAVTAMAEAGAAGLTGEAATAFVTNKVKEQTLKIAAASAAGEGVQTAGSIAEKGRQSGKDWNEYIAPALAAGLGTTAIGIASFGIGNKLGIGDIETDIAGRVAGIKGSSIGSQSALKRIAGEALKEGVLEEMPQSYQEQVFQNIATGRLTFEGANSAAASGLITGAAMGGGHAMFSGKYAPQESMPEVENAQPLLLENKPDPYISFPDGSVGKQSDVDGFIAALPEHQRSDAIARLLGYAPQENIPEQKTTADIMSASSVDKAIQNTREILNTPTEEMVHAKNAEIDKAFSTYISQKRQQEIDFAESQKRDQQAASILDQTRSQQVEQANAITKAQGFDEHELNAMQLAMRRAQNQKNLAFIPDSKRISNSDNVQQLEFSNAQKSQIDTDTPLVDEQSTIPTAEMQIPKQTINEYAPKEILRGNRVDISDSNLESIKPIENKNPIETEDNVMLVKPILDAANVIGRDRIDIIRAVRLGELTVKDVAEAHPSKAVQVKSAVVSGRHDAENQISTIKNAEVARYTSRQTFPSGVHKQGVGMTDLNARQLSSELNKKHPDIKHSPEERENGMYDVVGRESKKDGDVLYSKSQLGESNSEKISKYESLLIKAKEKYGIRPTPKNEAEVSAIKQKIEELTRSEKSPEIKEEGYRGQHKAPSSINGASASNVSDNGVYPTDFYGPNALKYYGGGSDYDAEAINKIKVLKGKPNSIVTIYRAVPSGVVDQINAGDWVTITKKYATAHGESALNGDYVILEKKVKAKEIFTNGDSIQEWGYSPETDIQYSKSEPTKNTHSTESIRLKLDEALNRYGKNFTKNLLGTSMVRLIDSDQARVILGNEPEGIAFYDQKSGVTSIIADRIGKDATVDELHGLMLHEVANHALEMGKSKPEFQKILRDLEVMNRAGNKEIKEAFNRAKKAETSHSEMASEALGYLLEKNSKLSIVQRVVAFIRKTIRSMGNKLPVVQRSEWFKSIDNMNVNDLTYAAQKALQDAPSALIIMEETGSGEVAFSKERKLGDKELEEISKIGDAFKYKKSDKTTLEGIISDLDDDIKVRKLTNIPDETRYELTLPDDTIARVMVRPFNKYGESLYGYDFDDNHNMTDQVTERPGRNQEEAYGKDDVWIDVSLLNQGSGYGSLIYSAVANYAYNTGKVFIGDPAGVTHAAMIRRPEQMLSSALKFGTTEHLAPHPKQIKGDTKKGIAPLDWVYGDDVGNIKKLILVNLQNIDNVGGIGGIKYDGRTGEFIGEDGARITREDLRGLAEAGLAKEAHAGSGTLARYSFLTSVLQSLPVEQSGRESVKFLAEFGRQLRDHVSTLDNRAEKTKDIFYSKSSLGTLNKDQEQVINEVFGKEKSLKEKADEFKKEWKKSTIQGIFDTFSPVKELSNKAYMLLRMTKGGASTLEHIMLYGKVIVDKDGAYASTYKKQDGMQGFAKVLAELNGEHDRFLKWVTGLRAEKLKDIGLENLMDRSQIAVLKTLNQGKMNNGKSRESVYADTLLKLNDFNDSVLKIAQDSGLVDEQTRLMYKNTPYIPFYRLQEDGASFGITSGVVNQKAWKKLKGGTSKLNDDMLVNLLQNWSHLITASAKNRAAKATLEAAVNAGIAEEVPSGTTGKGFVTFKDGGKERKFSVEDDHIMSAIGALEYAGLGVWSKPFTAMKNALTIGVTINPAFKIRNLIRDSIQSVAISDVSFNPAKNLKSGFLATQNDSETRAQMLASGGLIRFGSMLDGNNAEQARRAIEKNIPKDQILDDENKVKALWNKSVVPAFEAYQEMGDRGEQINRAALYERLVSPVSEGGKGMTHLEASFWARDMMDFSSSGKWEAVRVLTQVVPFMNARLQGMYKLGRASQEGETWKIGSVEFSKRMGYTIGAVALASIALMAYYHDDDDWQKRTDADRENYWWFKIGDKAFLIPKPFEVGSIGTIAEMGAEYFISDDMTGKRFMNNIGSIAGNQLSMNPIPQLMKPLLDVYANTDSFTKQPIESMAMQRLQAKDRYTDKTSEMARFLGGLGLPDPIMLMMGHYNELSPVKIDALTRGYFSWLGTMATTALDYGIRPIMDRGERPSMKLDEVFFAGNFVKDLPSSQSRYVNMMYEQSVAIEQAYNSYMSAIKSGDRDKAKQIMKDDKDLIAKYPKIEMVKKYEAQINAHIKLISSSKIISASEKRKQIDILKEKQDKIARLVSI